DEDLLLPVRELCEPLADRQEKVLVFTQFRETTEPLARFLATVFGRNGIVLHGGTPVKERKKLVELLGGKLSRGVMEIVTHKARGLFPSPEEISLSCSCPDWATMCKHVAAAMYGVGARLDAQPELLFRLRGVDPAQLIAKSVGRAATKASRPRSRTLADEALGDIFGIEIDEPARKAPKPKAVRARKPAPDEATAPARRVPRMPAAAEATKTTQLARLRRRPAGATVFVTSEKRLGCKARRPDELESTLRSDDDASGRAAQVRTQRRH
ncbi:MAG TPA: hypothetical protein VM925_12845, partial [Labilithrix sp.]|nr:hypothetical protein [Labilithrix sp.]